MPGPRTDGLGIGCFLFHMSVGAYVLVGWLFSCQPALLIYLGLLPAMATGWRLNRHSCVLNNLESLMRSGRWRDPESREEGGFHHCQVDNVTIGVHAMWDWIEEVLKPGS